MSSKSKTIITQTKDEKTYEIVSIAFGGVMILVALLVVLLNLRLARRVATRRKHPNIKKLRKMLIKARSAVKTGMLTAIETVILALEAGMTLEDVRLEYVSGTNRDEILESVFGKLLEKFLMKLKTSGRFMETGFANEKVFLDLWKSESYREMIMTQNREECRTQTFLLPVVDDPVSSQSNAQTEQETKKENPDRSPSRDPAPNKKRQSTRDLKKTMFLQEKRPFICSGNNDDAQ